MKNRKFVVAAFLLAAAMLLGVGYAAVSDVLDIIGTVDISSDAAEEAFNEDIYFSSAVANDYDGDPNTPNVNVASIIVGDPDMASFTVNSLKGKGDTATFTFTITNDGDLDATIAPSLAADGNTQPTYFNIYSDWAKDQEGNVIPKLLAAGQSITYTLTVELLQTPTTAVHGKFDIDLTAVSVDVTP